MNKLNGFICALLLLLLSSTLASAQLYDKLVKECKKMNNVFTDTGYQSITIKYYFSTDKNAAYTDSLSASLKTHNGNYYGKFGNTESVQNKQYLVTIYNSNNSIVVSSPLSRNRLPLATANLDSAFLANDIDSAWITESGAFKIIRFRFTKVSGFKNYSITYNKTSYQVQKIVYAMKQQLLSDADTLNMPANPLITILFSGYSKAIFSDNIFKHDTYIRKDSADQFSGVGIYSSYQVLNTCQPADTSKDAGFFRHLYLNGHPGPLYACAGTLLPGNTPQELNFTMSVFVFEKYVRKPAFAAGTRNCATIKCSEAAG